MNRKELVAKLLESCARGNPDALFMEHMSSDCKHHNIFFKGDIKSLVSAIKENAKAMPHISVNIKRIIEDGDLVAVHSHIQASPEALGSATMHIFKFENNKIVEMWDFGQEIPEEIVNENGMF